MVYIINTQITGPLQDYKSQLWKKLLSLGYTLFSARNLMRLTAQFSYQLQSKGVHLENLTVEHVDQFLMSRKRSGHKHFITRRALYPMLNYLENCGAIHSLDLLVPEPLDPPLQDYKHYLLHERSITSTTSNQYLSVAKRLLKDCFSKASIDLSRLSPRDIVSFVLNDSRRLSVGTTKLTVCALRSFLNFIYMEGETALDLAKVVPAISGQRHSGLPKGLQPREVQQLLQTCDRRTHAGREHYVMLLLLVRLGLRCCEVATLELEDINWRQGEITIRGKGQEECLPLPEDIGEALTRYLKTRRTCDDRHVFLRSLAPNGPIHAGGIKMIVKKHLVKAGISPPRPHRLRHTAATQMLRQGASLDEIAQVLRHHSLGTTVIYARVDHNRLRTLSQPWPEVSDE